MTANFLISQMHDLRKAMSIDVVKEIFEGVDVEAQLNRLQKRLEMVGYES